MTDALAIGLDLLAGLLAEEQPRDTGPDFGKASPVGLVIIVLLLIGTVFLIWSMNRHLRRLPESFDRGHPEPDQATDEGTVGAEADSKSDNDNSAGNAPREPGG
jgi:hypothetical protein